MTTQPTSPRTGPRPAGPVVVLLTAFFVVAAPLAAWFLVRDGGDDRGADTTVAATADGPDVVRQIGSDESGILIAPGGATLEIPLGAVPETQDGQVGQIVFTLDEQPVADMQANLPAGLELAHTALEIGPDFQTLATPAILTMPIPEDVPAETVGGLAWFDETTEQWVLVPARIDEAKQTISAAVTHFSLWTWWREDDSRWRSDNGSYVEVANHISSSITFPTGFFGWGDERNSYTSYGMCVDSYYVEDEALRDNTWWEPYDWTIMQRAFPGSDFESRQEGSYRYWLPQGTYEMREVIYFSEMNRSTGYVPAYGWASRPLGTVVVSTGGDVEHTWSEEEQVGDYSLQTGGWTAGRPACAGAEMPAPGHGDVQVQLIWPEEAVDLDLHVTEPGGFEIYYIEDESPSGGWLDQDNTFGAGVPENVFWQEPPSGTYVVEVVYFSGTAPATWTVRTIVEGEIQVYRGTISPSDGEEQPRITVATFEAG